MGFHNLRCHTYHTLPEALRGFEDYRMLIYAIVLILVMLATNSPQIKNLVEKIIPRRKKGEEADEEAA